MLKIRKKQEDNTNVSRMGSLAKDAGHTVSKEGKEIDGQTERVFSRSSSRSFGSRQNYAGKAWYMEGSSARLRVRSSLVNSSSSVDVEVELTNCLGEPPILASEVFCQ